MILALLLIIIGLEIWGRINDFFSTKNQKQIMADINALQEEFTKLEASVSGIIDVVKAELAENKRLTDEIAATDGEVTPEQADALVQRLQSMEANIAAVIPEQGGGID